MSRPNIPVTKLFKQYTSIIIVLLFVLASISVYFIASQRQKTEIIRLTEATAHEETSYLLENLNDRLTFVINDLMDENGGDSIYPKNMNEHIGRTKHLIDANSFLQTINYIDEDRRIKYVSPYEQNKAVIGLKIDIAAPKEALEMAEAAYSPYLSRPFEIIQGTIGYSLMVPLDNSAFYEIVFKADSVFGGASPFLHGQNVVLNITDGDVPVVRTPEFDNGYQAVMTGTILNRDIQISAFPTDQLINSSSQFYQTISVSAISLSFILMISIIITQAVNIKRRRQINLELQIALRKEKEYQRELTRVYYQEEALKRELQQEIKRRADFTRTLVHELKNPLVPIIASSNMLSEILKDNESLVELARNIEKGADNMNRRISELSDMAKVEVDKLKVYPMEIEPLPLLHEVIELMRPVSVSHGQSLIANMPSSLPRIMADEDRLRQILLNLLSNAIKFTPPEGLITITAKETEGVLTVEIQDTGIGINKKDLEKIFHPYYRGGSDEHRPEGLGIGLTLCKKLVELHGGQISVSSKMGEGSIFRFSIPVVSKIQRSEPDEELNINEIKSPVY